MRDNPFDDPNAKPGTLANYLAQGYTRVQVWCGNYECHHGAKVSAGNLPREMSFRQLAKLFRCEKCGEKSAWLQIDIEEHYAMIKEKTGYGLHNDKLY